MSYPISTDVLELFKTQHKQIVDITFYGTGETIHLTENDIVQGGLSIDRYTVSGSRIEIGSAVASELTINLNNKDGRFNNTVFEGAELFVRIGTKKWEARKWENAATHYVPMGYFTVDNSPRKLSSISLTALDRMVMFDKHCKTSDLSFPMTVGQLLERISTICGVTLATNSSTLLNTSYRIGAYPLGDDLTYRQLLMWIGEITGTCAYIDWDGKLRLEWYSSQSIESITPNLRFSSDLNEKNITITGVSITDNEDNTYQSGTNDYAFNIESNGLLQTGLQNIADSLFNKLGGFTYTPYNCTIKPLIHLYPLDSITYVNKNGTSVSSIVTNLTFTINGNISIAGQGETGTSDGYAKANPMTKQEAVIIAGIKDSIDNQITTRQQSILSLNETIANSLGLYRTEVEQLDGSIVYYFHNGLTLADSSIIYTLKEGGFAWSSEWNGDETVWQYGITYDGNAVLNILSAHKIQAEYLDAGCITAEKLSVEYTDSVTNEISQTLQAGFGEFESTIIADITDSMNTMSTQILQNTNQISLVVTETENGDVINSASIITAINNDESVITLNANKINLTAYPKTSDLSLAVSSNGNTSKTVKLKNGSDVIDSATITITGVVEFADLYDGTTTISGNNITTGTISASRIDTENLYCTRLYAKSYENGYNARLNGSWGDFGVFIPSASNSDNAFNTSCMWGVYQSDSITQAVNFYVYGNNYAGYNGNADTFFPKGSWDFGSCDVSNLSASNAIAVFG